MASEKINDKIMTIKILADAEGLRATDFTAAEPTKAITAAGPAVLKNITKIKAKVDIFCKSRKQFYYFPSLNLHKQN